MTNLSTWRDLRLSPSPRPQEHYPTMNYSRPSQRCVSECRLDPDIICSSVNGRLHKISPRLASRFAVNQMISKIRGRKVVHKLCANYLGEAGCIQLLDFLTSPAGFHCRESLTELYLPKNEIGAQGLLAIARFLRNNTVLRELGLYGNALTTDPDVVMEFTSALNSSCLRILLILDETCPGDPFMRLLLPKLAAPHLHNLRVETKCSEDIIPILVDYLRSSQCRLHQLDCGLSRVTPEGASRIATAIGMNKFLLHSAFHLDFEIENHFPGIGPDMVKGSQTLYTHVRRNSEYNALVRDESLALLRYCRALFLHSGKGTANSSSRFFDLPVELLEEIIAYLTRSLSLQQRRRIMSYAADISTLFAPGHQVNAGRGVIERTNMSIKTFLKITSPLKTERFGGKPPTCRGCDSSSGLELTCPRRRSWRMNMRELWLTEVGCDAYEYPSPLSSSPRFPVMHDRTVHSFTVTYVQ